MMKVYLILLVITVSLFGQEAIVVEDLENFIRAELEDSRQNKDHKCGTAYDLQIHHPGANIDPLLLQKYLVRTRTAPVRQKSVLSARGYFNLHWDESGPNAVPLTDKSNNGIPDYIDSAAVIFENVRWQEVAQMGYRPPPGEDGQEAIPYDIYFSQMNFYGITRPSYIDIEALPGENYTSYIEIENDFWGFPTAGLDGLRVTAAHEYHHAIQLGYNVRWEDTYFYEMTSTWMEEMVYPEINDYLNYLSDFFDNVSNTPFNQSSGYYPYANSLYLQMLQLLIGEEIVKQIWDYMLSKSPIDAISAALTGVNSSWRSSLGAYGMWLYFTGSRTIPGEFFPEAQAYPQIRIKPADFLDFDEGVNEIIVTAATANRYIMFSDLKVNNLNFRVEADQGSEGGFHHVTPSSYSQFFPLNTLISNQYIDAYEMVVILSNATDENFAYSLNISTGENADQTSVYAYPNPANRDRISSIRFLNVPPDADLYIYNTVGERIAFLPATGGSTIRSWPLSNEKGDPVVSGIYMYFIKGGNKDVTGKFSIIR